MPVKLSTTVKKIESIPNSTNSALLREFHVYKNSNGASESHQNNNLKVLTAFALSLESKVTFPDIKDSIPIINFLNSKLKDANHDPERKSVITWNDYLGRIKYFFRWLHNKEGKNALVYQSEWVTPNFAKIKEKKTKRLSPYLEAELWEQDEILSVIKYEPYKRNKAALTLFWDLDARNHEVTMLKIKHIRLREQYGEGEIPNEAKTGSGPALLTCSFPYVRDWLNEHPFRNESEARLICNIHTGGPVKPDAMWKVMKQLRKRIIHLLQNDSIIDKQEKEKLEFLTKTKKWNPYCIRHSAISSDSDFLPEYALEKKVRWSMNSKQGARYIKRRMGNDLKKQILTHAGVLTGENIQNKPSVAICPRCDFVNALDNKYCSTCSYPLIPSAFEEIKTAEETKIRLLEEKYEKDIQAIRAEMEDKFQKILVKIDTSRLG